MVPTPPVAGLMAAIDRSIARGSDERCSDSLRRMTDLFLQQASGLDATRVAVFDQVIGRLADEAEAAPRAELAARLANVDNAPPALVRRLARDEIAVAQPLLARSSQLTDADLAAIAAAKGRDHMLAIVERDSLGEAVTDVLVSAGDRAVAHAVACNPGARLSGEASSALVQRAGRDGTLRALLTGRADLPEAQQQQLANPTLPEAAPAQVEPLETEEARARYSRALAAVQTLSDLRPLGEGDLMAFLEGGEVPEAICTLALAAGLPVSVAVRLFDRGRADLLLLVVKAQGWAWDTAEALLALQAGPGAAPDPRLGRAYAAVDPAMAARVHAVLSARTRSRPAEPRQIRSKVR